MTTPSPSDDQREESPWAVPDAPPASPAAPPAPYAAPPAFPGAQPPRNRFALVALLTGVFGLVLFAVGFGIASLVQIGRRGERGRGMAIGGLVAAALWVFGSIAVGALIAVGSVVAPDRDASGRVSGSSQVLLTALRPGDCFTGFTDQETKPLVTVLPCTRAHDGEAIAKTALPSGDHPGANETQRRAETLCRDQINDRLGASRHINDLDVYANAPTAEEWRSGNRDVLCVARYTGSEKTLTTALTDTVDPALREWTKVKRGDCIDSWGSDDTPFERVVDCGKPHEQQVVAVYTLPEGPWPGEKKLDERAWDGCEKRMEEVFDKHPSPVPVEQRYTTLTRKQWGLGIRTVVCMVRAEKGDLKRSVVK